MNMHPEIMLRLQRAEQPQLQHPDVLLAVRDTRADRRWRHRGRTSAQPSWRHPLRPHAGR